MIEFKHEKCGSSVIDRYFFKGNGKFGVVSIWNDNALSKYVHGIKPYTVFFKGYNMCNTVRKDFTDFSTCSEYAMRKILKLSHEL